MTNVTLLKYLKINLKKSLEKNNEQAHAFLTEDNTVTISVNSVVLEEVSNCINSIKPRTAIGPDRIPSYVIKGCKSILAPLLLNIMNKSLQECVFPEEWKQAFIVPIYKNGDKFNYLNYRPITILNCCSKVFEKIVHKHLIFQLQCVLHPSQHGFVKGRSITTNLVSITDSISNALHARKQVDVIYFDLSAAFDSVDHEILLQKLQNVGFSPKLVKWFKSYLSGRTFIVKANNLYSEVGSIYKGVPQGSSLGPLLFAIFINDLPFLFDHADTKILLYADDIKLFKIIHDYEDSSELQKGIDTVYNWSLRNKQCRFSLRASNCNGGLARCMKCNIYA